MVSRDCTRTTWYNLSCGTVLYCTACSCPQRTAVHISLAALYLSSMAQRRKRARYDVVAEYKGMQCNRHIGAIVLLQSDIRRLLNNEYITDNVVDLLSHRLLESLPDELRARVYIFPAAFWKRLSQAISPEQWADVDSVERICRQIRVSRWTKRDDIFCKEWLFFPIGRDEHWSLAVAHHPMRVHGPWGIYSLCSLGHPGKDVRSLLTSYLQGEFCAKKLCLPNENASSWRELNRSPMWSRVEPESFLGSFLSTGRFVSADMRVARQHNGYDCCFYMHEFMKRLAFEQPSLASYGSVQLDVTQSHPRHTCSWSDLPIAEITARDVGDARPCLLQIIRNLSGQQTQSPSSAPLSPQPPVPSPSPQPPPQPTPQPPPLPLSVPPQPSSVAPQSPLLPPLSSSLSRSSAESRPLYDPTSSRLFQYVTAVDLWWHAFKRSRGAN